MDTTVLDMPREKGTRSYFRLFFSGIFTEREGTRCITVSGRLINGSSEHEFLRVPFLETEGMIMAV